MIRLLYTTMDKGIIWILGHGPVHIDHQFEVDIPRQSCYINNIQLPKDKTDAIRILYEICGIHYYKYTKFLNQSMGNMILKYLRRIEGGILVPVRHSYKVYAFCNNNKNIVKGKINVRVYDDAVKNYYVIGCTITMDLMTYLPTLKINYL